MLVRILSCYDLKFLWYANVWVKKLSILQEFDLWPLITRSNINLGQPNAPPIMSTRREHPLFFPLISTTLSFEKHGHCSNPPPTRPHYENRHTQARVNTQWSLTAIVWYIFREIFTQNVKLIKDNDQSHTKTFLQNWHFCGRETQEFFIHFLLQIKTLFNFGFHHLISSTLH